MPTGNRRLCHPPRCRGRRLVDVLHLDHASLLDEILNGARRSLVHRLSEVLRIKVNTVRK
jgi:hypothetical protein